MKNIKKVLEKINTSKIEGFKKSDKFYTDLGNKIDINSFSYIDGEFYELKSKNYHNLKTPITGDEIIKIPNANKDDVDYAVRIAKTSFESDSWSGLLPSARKEILIRWAELIEKNVDHLTFLEAFFSGKPVKYAKNVDVLGTAKTIRWYAELIDKTYDSIAPKSSDGFEMIIHEPKGVIGIIVPWNYPLLIGSWKFAPALAAGNSIVMKPDEKTPLTTIEIARLAHEAGIPKGAFNVITGDAITGSELIKHELVNHIGFTGSTATGLEIMKNIGNSNLKSMSLECGGKSPVVILEDADIELATDQIAFTMFYNMGQSCNAPSRAIVHSSIKSEFEAKLIAKSKKFYPNNPLNSDTEVGPLISQNHYKTVCDYIESGKHDGCNLLSGNINLYKESGGAYLSPTILNEVDNNMKITQEEIFGPVITVDYFENIDEAIRIANDTKYGLWAAVFTNDISKFKVLARKLKAGSVCFNKVFGGNITTPFGGVKQSGFSKDRSNLALFNYMDTKHISL
jgi:acyl-CoA reductase-like NAD-dependent aldehyde dehydrogenase